MSIELYLSQNRIADLEAQVKKLHSLVIYTISTIPDHLTDGFDEKKLKIHELLENIVNGDIVNGDIINEPINNNYYLPMPIDKKYGRNELRTVLSIDDPNNDYYKLPMTIDELCIDADDNCIDDNCIKDKQYCIGCIENQPNQMAHMDFGGCLYREFEYSDDGMIDICDAVRIETSMVIADDKDNTNNFIEENDKEDEEEEETEE